MKHIKTVIMTVVLAGMLCTGCGAVGNIKEYSHEVSDAGQNSGEITGNKEKNKNNEIDNNENDISGGRSDVKKAEEKKCYYENDDNSYDVSYDNDNNGYLVEYGLKSKKIVKKIGIKDINEVVWVTNEWVYYTKDNGNAASLWRIPIKKTEKADKLKVSEKEKLISMDDIGVYVYISDSYIIFLGREKGNKIASLFKYEINDKKYTKLFNMDMEYGNILYGEDYPFIIDGMLFIYDDCNVYKLNPDTGESKKIYQSLSKDNELDFGLYDNIISGDCLYFKDDGNNLYRYNVNADKAKCIISSDSFEKAMEKLNLCGKKSTEVHYYLNSFYIYNGKMYFVADAFWDETDNKIFGKSVLVEYEYGHVLLSAPLDDIFKIQCVEDVRNFFDGNTKWDTYEEEQRYYSHKDMDIDFLDGKIVLDISVGEGDLFAVYNLDTGKIKEIGEKEWKEMYK